MSAVTAPTSRRGYGAPAVPHFSYDQPAARIIFGQATLSVVSAEVERLEAQRILLVATRSAAEPAALVAASLGERVVGMVERVRQHVPIEDVGAVAETVHVNEVDAILAIGGGSAIGLAKGVAHETRVPILAVPTTYSGSEMTPIFGITKDGQKLTSRDPSVQPRSVIYDVDLTLGLAADVTAASGLNAMAHCVEALYASEVPAIIEAAGREGLRHLLTSLARSVTHPGDVHARQECLRGAHLAGVALAGAAMGLHHHLCHVLGGAFALDHARTHAVLLPYVLRAVDREVPASLHGVRRAVGSDDPAVAIRAVVLETGIPATLAELGLKPDQIDLAVRLAGEHPVRSPWQANDAAIRGILWSALKGGTLS